MSSRIVNQVLDALFSRKISSGEFLGTEADLGKMFKTSRVPVREALGRLESLGVVTIKTGIGGGATIADGRPDQFATALAIQFLLIGVSASELFDARIAVECRATELAAERITDEELADLRVRLDNITERGPSPATTEEILAFHRAIVDSSRSRTLITLMHGLEHALLNLYLDVPVRTSTAPKTYPMLHKILECLEQHNSEAAFQTMRSHLLSQQSAVVERFASAEVRDEDANRPVTG
ncbi:FadR/GntR family transcriptional regulator [Aurantiacibacter gilvus]|uniref:FCD domain-containing protein n=1 Tax=Aurantiacibacter gilvus TaxID=3139141 RepID=A0ABU9IFI8_9SPHN